MAHEDWVDARFAWWKDLGLEPRRLRLRPHSAEELAHYAKATTDIEYQFPFGWGELEGIANRTDFDLKRHAEASGTDLSYFDDAAKQTRHALRHRAGGRRRPRGPGLPVRRLHRAGSRGETADVPEPRPEARPLQGRRIPARPQPAATGGIGHPNRRRPARPIGPIFYDASGSIGRRYARQDEAGTPVRRNRRL